MFFKKKSESGRSMVEMLGVLAIIGVLSIGGIAGYTLSMRRYRANQVLDVVNKYALIVYDSCQKAVVDGNVSDIGRCFSSHVPSFEETDLSLVADIKSVFYTDIVEDGKNDIVEICIGFYDNQICKATVSVVGSKASDQCSIYDRACIPVFFN